MVEPQSLREELRGLIRNWMQQWLLLDEATKATEATPAELITMACLMSDRPLYHPEVLTWMSTYSSLFANCNTDRLPEVAEKDSREPSTRFASFCKTPLLYDKKDSHKRPTCLASFSEAQFLYDVPYYRTGSVAMPQWTAPIGRAYVFLRGRLSTRQPWAIHSHFRLMDLPTELRLQIFEYALLLPKSGVWYDFDYSFTPDRKLSGFFATVYTAQRDLTAEYRPGIWDVSFSSKKGLQDPTSGQHLFRVDIARHLALFQVSKQVYKEAMPCYYSKNVFYLHQDLAELSNKRTSENTSSLLNYLRPVESSLIENIIWCRRRRATFWARRDLQILSTLPRLRTLVIDTESQESKAGVIYKDMSFPGDVAPLTAITGLTELVLFGQVAALRIYLEANMTGPGSNTGASDTWTV